MAERSDQRTRERDVSVDVDTDLGSVLDDDGSAAAPASESDTGGGLRGRVGERVDGLFSVRTFGIALLLTVVLAFVAGAVVPLPASALIGVFLGGFAMGLASSDRSYLEIGAATLLSGAVTAFLGNLVLTLFGLGIPIVAMGAGASGLAGVVGHYFGRDLRTGLTRDV